MKLNRIQLFLLGVFSLLISFKGSTQTYLNATGTFTTCSGTFYDSGGAAGSYGNNENRITTLCATAGSCITVTFTDIDLQNNDILTVHDGPTNASPQLALFENVTNATGTYTSTTGCLTFWFTSNNSQVTNGWVANISCTPGCIGGCTDPAATNYNPLATFNNGTCTYPAPDYTMPTVGINSEYVGACLVTDCGPFTFTDNGGFTGNYSDNINAIYRTFCPDAAGQCMQVTFNSFQMYSGNTLDYLIVKNGPTQNSTDIVSLNSTNNGTPGPYTSTDASGCLTFRFVSSSVNNAAGWSATLECVPCAGGPSGTDNNDCVNMTPLCSTYSLSGNASGPGIVAEGCTGTDCPAGGENHTNWYTVTALTSGTLNITITPDDANDDYDFAIYGPNVTCGSLGSPIRCTDSGSTGTTGLGGDTDNTEDVTGDGQLATMNVLAGESYIIVVDEWSPNAGSGYDLTFSGTANLDCTILPVELSEFSLEYQSHLGAIDVFWTTESEHNSDYWEIERSSNGKDWEIIGRTEGAGTTHNTMKYLFVDENPVIGVNYYRLNQWDTDGSGKYSEIQSINILDDFYDLLSLFPNPTNGKTEVIYNSYTTEPSLLTVTDADGKIVVNTPIDTKKGGNRFELDMSGQSRGVYVVTITTRDKVYRTKLVKE